MSEDRTEPLNEPLSNSAQLEAILARLDRIESGLRAELERVESNLRAEVVERFLQVSQHVLKVNEKIDDLDEKVGVFIREQVHIKRELREVRDSLTPKN